MTTFILCKIAIKQNENLHDNVLNFEYNDIQWHLIERWHCFHRDIMDIILYFKHNDTTKVGFLLESQEILIEGFEEKQTVLLLTYQNVFKQNHKQEQITYDILLKIFPILFENYNIEDDLFLKMCQINNKDVSSKLIRTYVTTRLFTALYKSHEYNIDNKCPELNVPERFQPKLYKFQKRTVLWLLQREQQETYIPSFYQELKSRNNNLSLGNIYKHNCLLDMHDIKPLPIQIPKGGILAEEMGLGKTVEILALILLNPRKDGPFLKYNFDNYKCKNANERKNCTKVFCLCTNTKYTKGLIQCEGCNLWQHKSCVCKYDIEFNDDINQPYFCPSCWTNIFKTEGELKSAATFIVSPNSIRNQWVGEIKRHTDPPLNVLVYEGRDWISPRQLGAYDIVLTDYSVLRSEVYRTPDYISDRKIRRAPRCLRKPTPLLMLEWYRVCLDEAQMIESNTSKVPALVRTLPGE